MPNNISMKLREYIVYSIEILPVLAADYSFSKSNGRSFNPKLYFSTALNQLKIKRSWIVYSVRSDSIFCFCCVLSEGNRSKLSTSGSGYNDWNHVYRDLESHDDSTTCNRLRLMETIPQQMYASNNNRFKKKMLSYFISFSLNFFGAEKRNLAPGGDDNDYRFT